jgi:hypothetical protein
VRAPRPIAIDCLGRPKSLTNALTVQLLLDGIWPQQVDYRGKNEDNRYQDRPALNRAALRGSRGLPDRAH